MNIVQLAKMIMKKVLYVHIHCIDYNKLDVIIIAISVISDKSHSLFPPIFSLVHMEPGNHEINSTVRDVILLNRKLIIVHLVLFVTFIIYCCLIMLCHFIHCINTLVHSNSLQAGCFNPYI